MSASFDDAEIIAAAREGFLDEAVDMLRQFEDALLVMETAPGDTENLNAAFRAAHTIKGTAGLFGCDAVVAFTHEVESLMEALRSGKLAVTEPICAALLEGRDQMEALIGEVKSGANDPDVATRSQQLGQRLRALLGGPEAATPAANTAGQPQGHATTAAGKACGAAAASAASADATGNTNWHLSLRFGTDALRNGLDPLAFLRYLGSLGTVQGCHTFADAVPALDAIDAEACYLGFELQLQSERDQAAIEAVFEWALEDCSLRIVPPQADASAWAALLELRCGDDNNQRLELQAIWQTLGITLHQAAPTPLASEAAAHTASPVAPVPERRATTDDRRAAGVNDRRAGAETRFVKVRADKLDRLIDLIGELVIAGSGAQMVATREASAAFLEATQRVSDLVQATRDGALALRMVPVGETFSRFQRVVRDICKSLGKDIELVITGGDTELDKSMVEVIADPLMHLVRNSLDHGIETPAERVAAGKSGTGRLGLNAFHEGGHIVIEVTDDGRGLNRDKLVAKAVQRGLIAPDAVLSDQEAWQLIFAPGFSTAEQVTDISGRGVGMDVVRRNIESLRGQISLASQPGRGTTTQIRLPLTLAMIDGFLTLVAGVHYVLPLAVVSECIAVPHEAVQALAQGSTAGTFDLRGEVLPWIDLARFYANALPDSSAPSDNARRSLVVVRDGSVRLGLVVDRLLGEHQTVIKPLPSLFKPLKALAGSTILGSGDVALVLDMQGLQAAAVQHGAAVRRAYVLQTPSSVSQKA